MVEYPISTLVAMGITDVVLVTGGNKPGQFLELLRNGSELGLKRLYYTYQEGNGGIVDALELAAPFVEENPCVVILGDNYFEEPPRLPDKYSGAHIYLKKVAQPWHFGIATVSDKKIVKLEEKPQNSTSDLAVIGCYCFDDSVWELLPAIKASNRGEREVTDLLSLYLREGRLTYSTYQSFWSDMGTFESWMYVSSRIKAKLAGSSEWTRFKRSIGEPH
jgi:glucose-1-phosphate thymidylyltransferase